MKSARYTVRVEGYNGKNRWESEGQFLVDEPITSEEAIRLFIQNRNLPEDQITGVEWYSDWHYSKASAYVEQRLRVIEDALVILGK